jgi:hypothetical protein
MVSVCHRVENKKLFADAGVLTVPGSAATPEVLYALAVANCMKRESDSHL